MIYPAINELTKKVGSRYSLVVATAKRARELVNGSDRLVEADSNKPVKIAVNEIYSGKIIISGAIKKPASTLDFTLNPMVKPMINQIIESTIDEPTDESMDEPMDEPTDELTVEENGETEAGDDDA